MERTDKILIALIVAMLGVIAIIHKPDPPERCECPGSGDVASNR